MGVKSAALGGGLFIVIIYMDMNGKEDTEREREREREERERERQRRSFKVAKERRKGGKLTVRMFGPGSRHRRVKRKADRESLKQQRHTECAAVEEE